MPTQRRIDHEEFVAATELAREIRSTVAEQARELIVEADRMAGHGDVANRINLVATAYRRIREAVGRQQQHRELGIAIEPAWRDEVEAKRLLRESLMNMIVAAALWASALDFELRKIELEDAAS